MNRMICSKFFRKYVSQIGIAALFLGAFGWDSSATAANRNIYEQYTSYLQAKLQDKQGREVTTVAVFPNIDISKKNVNVIVWVYSHNNEYKQQYFLPYVDESKLDQVASIAINEIQENLDNLRKFNHGVRSPINEGGGFQRSIPGAGISAGVGAGKAVGSIWVQLPEVAHGYVSEFDHTYWLRTQVQLDGALSMNQNPNEKVMVTRMRTQIFDMQMNQSIYHGDLNFTVHTVNAEASFKNSAGDVNSRVDLSTGASGGIAVRANHNFGMYLQMAMFFGLRLIAKDAPLRPTLTQNITGGIVIGDQFFVEGYAGILNMTANGIGAWNRGADIRWQVSDALSIKLMANYSSPAHSGGFSPWERDPFYLPNEGWTFTSAVDFKY